MSSQRYAVAHLITSLREQYKDQFVVPLMAAISTLLAGSPEQRDCAYHLFFYRCTEFPTIMAVRAPARRRGQRQVLPHRHRPPRPRRAA